MASDLNFVEFVVEQIEDREWMSNLIILTEKELPMPKPKKMKKRNRREP